MEHLLNDYLVYLNKQQISKITLKRSKAAFWKLNEFMQEREIKEVQELKVSDMALLKEYLIKTCSKSMQEVHESGINRFLSYLTEKKYLLLNPLLKYRKPYRPEDYPYEFRKYLDAYLKTLPENSKLLIYLPSKLNALIYYLTATKKLQKMEEVTGDILKEYINTRRKEKVSKSLIYISRCYIRKWFHWLLSNNVKLNVGKNIFPVKEVKELSEENREYLSFLESQNYRKESLQEAKRRLLILEEYLLGKRKEDINRADYESYLRGKNLSESKIKKVMGTSRLFLEYRVRKGKLKRNPLSSKEVKPKEIKEKKEKKSIITERIPEEYRILYADYLVYLKVRGHRIRGIKGIKIRACIIFEYMRESGIKQLRQIGIREAQKYQGWLMERGLKKGKEYSNRTLNCYLVTVTNFFQYLKYRKIILTNPFKEVKKAGKEKKLPYSLLKEKEMQVLLAGLRNFNKEKNLKDKITMYRVHVIGELMYATGLRIAEVASIKMEDIDFKRGIIKVNEGKFGESRIAFMNEYSLKVLEIYLNTMRNLVLNGHHQKRERLFGTDYDCLSKTVNKRLKKKVKELRLPYFTSHGFRHSMATHLLKKGCDIRYIQAILGHKNIKNTEIYTKVEKEDLKKILDKYHPRVFGLKREDKNNEAIDN